MDSLWNVYVTWKEHAVKCTVQISSHNTVQSFDQFGFRVRLGTNWLWVSVQLQSLKCRISRHLRARSSLKLNIEFEFILKRVRGTTRTCSQSHRTDKYSEQSSIIWPVWLNGWMFVYELSVSGFESSCSHLNFRFRTCFEQEVPWHSGNYRVWIHSETRTLHEKNIQSVKKCFLRCYVSFFLFSGIDQSYQFVGCNTTSIFVFKCFTMFLSIMPSQKSDIINSFRTIFIKNSIIKCYIIKIYTRNTRLITWKCGITRIFIKKVYIIIYE